MRIGIDARELMGRPTGVGRYLAQLLRAWGAPPSEVADRHEFVLYGPARMPAAVRAHCAALRVTERVLPGGGGTAWEQVALRRTVRSEPLDVFFAPAYTAPLGLRCPAVVTIHDLSFCAHPEWFTWREGVRRRLLTRASARGAAIVLTDSRFSASEISTHLGVPAGRIRVIPLGVDRPARPDGPCGSAPGTPRPAGGEPLVLFVGSVFNRRRVPDLIRAFAGVVRVHPAAQLAIIGENRTFPAQDLEAAAREAGVADCVSIRAYVTDTELEDAYRAASVFAFLSEYEGFGLTPLEALARGVPVVVLDTPVAREVCGDAAVYVVRDDVAGTAAAIASLIGDPAPRAALLSAAARVLDRYSWAAAARQTMEALEAARRSSHG